MNLRKPSLHGIILLAMLLFFQAYVVRAQSAIYAVDGIALDGTDVVSYFKEGRPAKGVAGHSLALYGVTWHFESIENLKLFTDNPEAYIPQFGGWCAYGVSENHKSPTSPEAWTIVDGRLYLNYNVRVKKLWLDERDTRIERAVGNWVTLKNKD